MRDSTNILSYEPARCGRFLEEGFNWVRSQISRRGTLQNTDAFNLMLSLWTLDQAPSIVELGLHRYVRLRYLLLVLEAKYLEDWVSAEPTSSFSRVESHLEFVIGE